MSVLIKGMEKPKSCTWWDGRCPLLGDDDDCKLQDCQEEWTWQDQYKGCPLSDAPDTNVDTISRQAAFDAIRASTSKYTGFMEMEMYTDDDAVEAIKALPSAQKKGYTKADYIMALHKEYGCSLARAEKAHQKLRIFTEYVNDERVIFMDDLISRQDVLALAKDVTLQNGCKHRCIDATMIHELPPAQLGTMAVRGYPIDADYLMAKVAEEYGERARDALYRIIRYMPPAQSEPQWIPVSEQLPENRDWVLGIFQEVDTGWINPIPFICDYVGKKTPITTQDNWLLKLVDEPHPYYERLHCIAWMPLPEPYEGEQE